MLKALKNVRTPAQNKKKKSIDPQNHGTDPALNNPDPKSLSLDSAGRTVNGTVIMRRRDPPELYVHILNPPKDFPKEKLCSRDEEFCDKVLVVVVEIWIPPVPLEGRLESVNIFFNREWEVVSVL